MEIQLSFVAWLCSCLSSVRGGNSTDLDIHTNGTETGDFTVDPRKSVDWGEGILSKMMIVLLVVLVLVGAVFIIRYMRADRKGSSKRYKRLSKAEDDDDIELSIYEKR